MCLLLTHMHIHWANIISMFFSRSMDEIADEAQAARLAIEWSLKHSLKHQCNKKVVSMLEGFWKVAQLHESTNLLEILRKCVPKIK
jgi:hypothetical protein